MMGFEEAIKKHAKTLDKLEEKARELHNELCWGNRKDIGVKFPRTPLTKQEYREKATAYHSDEWVRVEDAVAVYRLHCKKLAELLKNRPPKSCTNHASLRLYYEEAEKVFGEMEGLLKK